MTDHDDFLDELRRRADRVHAHTPDAAAPPSGIWQHVLASTQPQSETKEHPEMMQPALATPTGVVSRPSSRQSITRFTNMAATLLVVAAIAFSGWFAAMNLQPGGDGAGGFLASNNQSETCDVTPLTVDEVMQIVKNPYEFLDEHSGSEGKLDEVTRGYLTENELSEAILFPSHEEFKTANRSIPSDELFEKSGAVVDRFLACMPTATVGQFWAMIDPVWVQAHLLGGFPVFVTEAELRVEVEETIDQPLTELPDPLASFIKAYGDIQAVANPNIDKAEVVHTSNGFMEPVVAFGVRITTADGEVVLETNSRGFPEELPQGSVPQRSVIVVGQSTISGEWYVLPWLGN